MKEHQQTLPGFPVKKTLFPSSALRWQISSPTWFEVTHISLGKTSTEIFLTSFVLCRFCGREILAVAVCWDIKDPREAVQRAGNCREHPSLLSRFGCWGLGSDGSDPDPAWPQPTPHSSRRPAQCDWSCLLHVAWSPRPTLVAQQAHTTNFHTKNSFRRSGLSVDLCACLALYLYFFLTDLPKIVLTSLNASP